MSGLTDCVPARDRIAAPVACSPSVLSRSAQRLSGSKTLRILHCVTLVSPDGAYGGPLRVAVNQASELAARGHQVVVAASCRGFSTPPADVSGVPLQLFPARRVLPKTGFAGLCSPSMLAWIRRTAASFDIVHIHLARDLVTLPAARIVSGRGVPFVAQTHGMIDPSSNVLAKPLDAVWTRRTLKEAAQLLYLTSAERDSLRDVGGADLQLHQLRNGVPQGEPGSRLFDDSSEPEVLFVARMHERKRPMMFIEAARTLLGRGVRARFTMIGADEGMGTSIKDALARDSCGDRIRWIGAIPPDQVAQYLTRGSLLVNTTENEPYAMSILEALSFGLPVVAGHSGGLSTEIEQLNCGLRVEETANGYADGVMRILSDRALHKRMSENALIAAREDFSIAAVCDELENRYRDAVGARI